MSLESVPSRLSIAYHASELQILPSDVNGKVGATTDSAVFLSPMQKHGSFRAEELGNVVKLCVPNRRARRNGNCPLFPEVVPKGRGFARNLGARVCFHWHDMVVHRTQTIRK